MFPPAELLSRARASAAVAISRAAQNWRIAARGSARGTLTVRSSQPSANDCEAPCVALLPHVWLTRQPEHVTLRRCSLLDCTQVADMPEEARGAVLQRFAQDVDGTRRPAPAPGGGAVDGAGAEPAGKLPGGTHGAPCVC